MAGKGGAKAAKPQRICRWKRHIYWGLLAGFAQDSMEVQLKNDDGTDEKVSMDGNGFSFKAMMDYRLLENVWFRGTTGVEQFVTAGSALYWSSQNATCETDIMYLSLDPMGSLRILRAEDSTLGRSGIQPAGPSLQVFHSPGQETRSPTRL